MEKPSKPEDFVRVVKSHNDVVQTLEVCDGECWVAIEQTRNNYARTNSHLAFIRDAILAACELETAPLMEFVREVAAESHAELCPLKHSAYKGKWCGACEAKKLLEARE